MSDLYPYCSKCDKELNDKEKVLNEKYDNLFYPICQDCLTIHTKTVIELADDAIN